jgi:hypothetical protein
MGKSISRTSVFTGRWRIVSMSAWDKEFIEEEEEGYFEFDQTNNGQFHFGYVHGQMNWRLTTQDGDAAVEWTWDGNDEMDPAQGRGWAVMKGDELHGMIFIYSGDDSDFVAKKADSRKKAKK